MSRRRRKKDEEGCLLSLTALRREEKEARVIRKFHGAVNKALLQAETLIYLGNYCFKTVKHCLKLSSNHEIVNKADDDLQRNN